MPVENLIQRADLNQRLTRALEIKGQKSPILQLDSIVTPVVLVEDLTTQAEWTTPTERNLASSHAITAVVGETPILAILNPVGSGVVGVVQRICTWPGGLNIPSKFGLVDPLALPVNPANLFFRDRRNVGAPAHRAFWGTDPVLRIVNEYLTIQSSSATSTPWFETPGIVIQQGDAFGLQATTLGSACTFTIWLEEIPV
jgi:hypothetical protein